MEQKIEIHDRTIAAAKLIKQKGYTLRQAAKQLNVSKSTVWHDLKKRLPDYNQELSTEVSKILKINFDNCHLLGGEATREKWRLIKESGKPYQYEPRIPKKRGESFG